MTDAARSSPTPTVAAVAFVPPSLPDDVLPRCELQSRLRPTSSTRLSLITGPAGSGKSTLARAWTVELDRPWAWLTVEERAGRPERFWPAFVGAIQMSAPDVVLDTVDAVGADAVDGGAIVSSLVDDLLRMGDRTATVVVDDAHLIGGDTWSDLAWLVTHLPPALHLVLVSRSDPPFSIARLRALGLVSEVRQRELAFTREETTQLVGHHVPDAPDGLIDALQDRTEGWAAGIRLALISLDRHPGTAPAQLLSTRDDAHGFVSELLITEALEHLPEEVRHFLTACCVVDVLEPDLCDVLARRDDSRAVLRRLAQDHVFITALADRPHVYRFHPLFAEVLRDELRAGPGDAEAAQHVRAAEWYEAAGRWAPAIEHSLAGGHHDLAFDLVVDHLGDLYRDGQRAAVGHWLLAIPESFICRDPARAVDLCAALLFLVRPEWLTWVPRARAIVGEDRPDLLARLLLFESLSWAGRGDLAQFDAAVASARALRTPTDVDPFDEVIDAWRARLLVLHGDAPGGLQIARDINRRRRLLIQDAPALSLLAAVAWAAGDRSAPDLVGAAIGAWRAMGEPDLLGMADALTVGADLALEHGDLADAEVLAAGAVAVSADRPLHLIGLRAELALARVDRAGGRHAEAGRRLGELRRAIEDVEDPPALMALLAEVEGPNQEPRPAVIAERRASAIVEPLTERETVILRQLAGHRTYPEIGRELFISRHTVKTHVSRIYRKLGVSGRSEAVRAADAHGLLST